MSTISSWLYTIFIISLFAGVADIFAPLGETKKYVKYIVSLVILIALAVPVTKVLKNVPQFLNGLSQITKENEYKNVSEDIKTDGEKDIYASMIGAGREEIAAYLCMNLCNRFGLPEEIVTMDISLDDMDLENVLITEIVIYVYMRADEDDTAMPEADALSKYIAGITGCERVKAVIGNETERSIR